MSCTGPHLKATRLAMAFVAFCIIWSHASAQRPATDSLEQVYHASEGKEKAYALYELVYSCMRSDVKKAEKYFGDVKRWSRDGARAEILPYLALTKGVYYGRTGLLDSALHHLEIADRHARELNDHRALLRIYTALGTTNVFAGKPEKGIDFMFEGLRLVATYPDKELEFKFYSNIAWAYLELKRFRDCINQGRRNIEMMEGTKYDWVALYSYNNVAVCYGASGMLDSARFFIEKGIHAAQEGNDYQSLANGYFILGKIYADAGKYDLAIEQYLKARPYREKVGNPIFIVSDLYTISDLYAKAGDYHKGIAAGKEALVLAEKFDLQMKLDWTYLSLAQNYEGLNDFRNASKYYRLWAIAKDSIYKHANADAIAEMQTLYETDKKEQQLALQQAKLAEQDLRIARTNIIVTALTVTLILIVIIFLLLRSRLKRKRELFLREAQIHATIESQESERRRFAQDLHDGMGQLISALRLALHSIHKETPLEERLRVVFKAESLLNDMHKEIRSIAFNLMPQTLVQSGLIPALKEMSSRISDSGKIAMRISSFDIPERLEGLQEISLYRIIQEWVNNVVKYAESSVIEVQLVGYEEEITLTIEDDGKGFDVRILEQNIGNGWKNIRSRINLIKASYDIDSSPGRKGTTFIIRAPLKATVMVTGIAVQPNTH